MAHGRGVLYGAARPSICAVSWRGSGRTRARGPPSRRPREPGRGGARGGCRSARGAGCRPRSPGSRACCARAPSTSSSHGVAVILISSSAGIGSMMRVSCSMSCSSSGGSKCPAATSSIGVSATTRAPRRGARPARRDLGRTVGDRPRGDRDLGVAAVEAGGDQGLVGGGAEVVAELAEGGLAQDAAHAFLGPAGESRGRPARAAVHQRPLQLQRALDPFARLDPVDALVGDQRRGAHRQRGADRAVALEHRAQRQQVVAEAVERGLSRSQPISKRPTAQVRAPSGSGRASSVGGELGQLDRLVLAQLVAAGAGRRGAGGDPAPAVLAGRGEGVGTEADAAAP